MDKAISDSAEARLREIFPDRAFTQVDVLGYGDDPYVEPGETAIRAFVDRGGIPAGTFHDDEEVIQGFANARHEEIDRLHDDGLLPGVAWVQLIPDAPERRAPGAVMWGFPSMHFGLRSDVSTRTPEFTTVETRLGPDDLAAVDGLIHAGIASSRAEALRWVIGRIRDTGEL